MTDVSIEQAPEPVGDLPPSCRLVWLYLAVKGGQTQQEIAEGTQTHARTARYALERLEAADVVDSRTSTRDARQSVYYLTNTE
jgi:DNA-binding MarR family transcriptional regulator